MIAAFLNRARAILPLLRLRPFDTTVPQGRSDERHRLIILSTLTSAIAKGMTIVTALISVPLTLHYLGPERYGMWATMSSFLIMLSFADLGIGNGLLNAVASAYGRDSRQDIRRYVSSAFLVLTTIAATIIVLFAAVYRHVRWFEIFNVQSDLARAEAGPALAVIIVCVALGVPIGIVQRVQTGMQRGFIANLWQCLASLLGLIGLVIAIHLEGGLPWLALAFVGAPLCASVINSVLFFRRLEPDIAPSSMSVSRDAVTVIVHTGFLFLGLQIAASVILASDNIFITQVLGPEAVTQYSVPERMFFLITSIAAMALSPLWPAYGEANARGDRVWVKRTLKRSLVISVSFAAIATSLLLLIGPLIIRIWVGTAVTPSLILLLGLALWKVIETGGAAAAMLLNSHGMVRFQLITATLVAISVVPLKIFLLHAVGVSGVVWATIICYVVFSAVPTFIFFRRWWKS